MSLFDKIPKSIKKGAEFVKKGTELIVRQADRSIRVEAIKADIASDKKRLSKKMEALAARAYELYENNEIDDREMIDVCRSIKKIRWEIDDKWSEIEKIRKAERRAVESLDDDWENDRESFGDESSEDEDLEKGDEGDSEEESAGEKKSEEKKPEEKKSGEKKPEEKESEEKESGEKESEEKESGEKKPEEKKSGKKVSWDDV